jgi:D-amino-acid oxidase
MVTGLMVKTAGMPAKEAVLENRLVVSGLVRRSQGRSGPLEGMRATVVGAGVIGLSVAAELKAAGAIVHCISDRHLNAITSYVAAGLIEPIAGTQDPQGAARELAAFARSYKIWATRYESGDPNVVKRTVEVYTRGRSGPLVWHDLVESYRELSRAERHQLYVDHDAATFASYVVDTRRWLPALRDTLLAAGVTFGSTHVRALDLPGDLIVNAAGLRAGRLAGDDTMYRGDGHVVVVTRPDDVHRVFMEEVRSDFDVCRDRLPIAMKYVIPRIEDVVLGGTLIASARVSHEPRTRIKIAERILELAIEIEPGLQGAEILDVRAAARPRRRDGTRVELDRNRTGAPVLHCYGTGGSGWTLAPALSESAVNMAIDWWVSR